MNKKNIYQDRVAEYLKEMEKDAESQTSGNTYKLYNFYINIFLVLFSSLCQEIEKMDTWTTKSNEVRDWNFIEVNHCHIKLFLLNDIIIARFIYNRTSN